MNWHASQIGGVSLLWKLCLSSQVPTEDCGGVYICLCTCIYVYVRAYWVPIQNVFFTMTSYCESSKKCLKNTIEHLAIWLFFFSLGFPPPGKSHGLHIFGILKVFPSYTQTSKTVRPQTWLCLRPQWQMKQLTSLLGCILWRILWIMSVSWQCKKMSTGIQWVYWAFVQICMQVYTYKPPHPW